MIPLVDAHAHCGGSEEMQARKNVLTMLCGTDEAEARRAIALQSDMRLACCAVHPWKSDRVDPDKMRPWMEKCPAIGEIGLDSVWTDVPMAAQRRALIRQLDMAREMGKPVVLHTKGMEREIGAILAGYTMKKLIHWYSCPDHLEAYLEQDCYFTVGPDFETNPAVQNVIRRVPKDRLMTETDGLSAVSWALGREVGAEEVERILLAEVGAIARAKGCAESEARRAVFENFHRFLKSE